MLDYLIGLFAGFVLAYVWENPVARVLMIAGIVIAGLIIALSELIGGGVL